MQSLADECTPLKQQYDSCFNLWFEGYLQPALDLASQQSRGAMPVAPSHTHEPVSPETQPSASSPSALPSASENPSPDTAVDRPPPPVSARKPLITSWANSSAFRRRPTPLFGHHHSRSPDCEHVTPGDDMVSSPHTHQADEEDNAEPLDTTGMTRAQIKAAQYERTCGRVWREYQGCLRKAIAQNQNLTTLLEQAQEEHPLHTMDGLEGTAWDPNPKAGSSD